MEDFVTLDQRSAAAGIHPAQVFHRQVHFCQLFAGGIDLVPLRVVEHQQGRAGGVEQVAVGGFVIEFKFVHGAVAWYRVRAV